MCQPAAPIEMKRRSMLVHSVNRVPAPSGSSCHRMLKSPQLYSSSLGASARVTLLSVTCCAGAPTVVRLTVLPVLPRSPSESNGAHSRNCDGSVSAFHTLSGEWCISRTSTSVHLSPSFCTFAFGGPGTYCSRAIIIFFSLVFAWWALVDANGRGDARGHRRGLTRVGGTVPASFRLP